MYTVIKTGGAWLSRLPSPYRWHHMDSLYLPGQGGPTGVWAESGMAGDSRFICESNSTATWKVNLVNQFEDKLSPPL